MTVLDQDVLKTMASARGATVEDMGKMICGLSHCDAEQCVDYQQLLAMKQTAEVFPAAVPQEQNTNPKTLMGNLKVRNLSVIPFTAIIHEARAMEYGAFHAPRKDGSKGYGPFNWRDQRIEFLTYAEAAIRHIASAVDREDIDPDTGDLQVMHLALARATLGILIDAIEHKTVIDDRSPTACGRVAALLRELRKTA